MSNTYDWFEKARFGFMLHWGLYTQLGGEWKGQRMDYIGEWIQSRFEIPNAEYGKLAQTMNPIYFDAEEWVKLAKECGMEYLVLTSKHHEGFAMYHSKVDKFNIVDATPFARDPIAELAEACYKHNMRLGLYYSQELDWHEPHGGGYTRGKTNHGMSWTNCWDYPDNDKKDFSICFENKIKPQVTEILTKYGDLALIWFDTPGVITLEQSRELHELVKHYQPGCMVNSRIGNGMGDYTSMGDNQIPTASGRADMHYETAATLNDTWGYKSFDQNWKTPEETVSLLTRLASRNTNYLLNVGPDALGRIPAAAQDIMHQVGDWMQKGGAEAVKGNEASPFPMDLASGPVTKKGSKLYFILNNPIAGGSVKVNGVKGLMLKSYLTREPGRSLVQVQHPMRGLVDLTRLGVMLPHDVRKNDVLCVQFMGEPQVPQMPVEQPDGKIELKASLAERMGDVKIGRGGSAEHWTDENALMGWHFATVRDGQFLLSLRAGGDYSQPAEQYELVVNVDGEELTLNAQNGQRDASLENHYLKLVEFALCQMELAEGEHDLSIRLAKPGQENLSLTSLVLSRVEA